MKAKITLSCRNHRQLDDLINQLNLVQDVDVNNITICPSEGLKDEL
jgi:acetolactate synthase regulatory subunit